MHLLPEPLFSIPTDNTYIMSIVGTHNGRIFMAGKDSCLYELAYQADDGWFSRKCRKINHSKSTLSFLVPSFLNFSFSVEGKDLNSKENSWNTWNDCCNDLDIWATSWENLFMPYANNKGADQTAQNSDCTDSVQSDQHLCCSLPRYSTRSEMLWSATFFRKREKDYVPR